MYSRSIDSLLFWKEHQGINADCERCSVVLGGALEHNNEAPLGYRRSLVFRESAASSGV